MLGRVARVDTIMVFNRNRLDCCEDRIIGARVLVDDYLCGTLNNGMSVVVRLEGGLGWSMTGIFSHFVRLKSTEPSPQTQDPSPSTLSYSPETGLRQGAQEQWMVTMMWRGSR